MLNLLPSTLLTLLYTAVCSAQSTPQSSCRTESQPNIIANHYFANITGGLNGTIAILPIQLSLARKIIPAKYEILTEQYRALLPDLPEDTYPAVLQAVFDHDVQYMSYVMPDFSRASVEFPFIKYFAEASIPFRYVPDMFLTSTNEMGINGSREYGGEVFPATFSPPCDAYAFSESQERGEEASGVTTYSARAPSASLDTTWTPEANITPSDALLSFIRHTTNQAVFGNNGMCNHQTRLFKTPLSTGSFAPRAVSGTVRVNVPSLFEEGKVWTEARGVQVYTPFVERHMIACEEMRGWVYDEGEEGPLAMLGTERKVEL